MNFEREKFVTFQRWASKWNFIICFSREFSIETRVSEQMFRDIFKSFQNCVQLFKKRDKFVEICFADFGSYKSKSQLLTTFTSDVDPRLEQVLYNEDFKNVQELDLIKNF